MLARSWPPMLARLLLSLALACAAVVASPLPPPFDGPATSAAPLRTDLGAPPAAGTPAPAAEDPDAQLRTLDGGYNLLLDRFVHTPEPGALLRAGWDQLAREAADRKAAPPGPPPALGADRAADLDAARASLASYLEHGGPFPDGFVPVHAMLRGMVRFLDEGHTYFLDPRQYRDYQAWTRGDNRYVGIGISLSAHAPEARVVEVYENSPAAAAGLQPGDVLLRANGQSLTGLPLDEMTSLLRGPAGSTLELVVRRGGDPALLTFTLTRAEVVIQFVTQRLLADGDIGYVQLRGFPEPSVADRVEQQVAAFQQQGVHGLVLDLRGNSGGRIDVGTRLLSHFLPSGTAVYEELDRGGQSHVHYVRGDATQYGLPLVVLVDAGTASMGEIFASAVQAQGAATVVGTPTAGSVAAAQVFGLDDGSGLQVTVYEILSPDGRPLNRQGVVPDEVVDGDAGGAEDAALSRAVDILHASTASPAADPAAAPRA